MPLGKYASTSPTVVGGGWPVGFALGAVIGWPSARTSACATGCAESRTPTVPEPAVTSTGTCGRAVSTSVSAPGQCRAMSARARSGISTARRSTMAMESTSTSSGLSSGRPFTWKMAGWRPGVRAAAPRP